MEAFNRVFSYQQDFHQLGELIIKYSMKNDNNSLEFILQNSMKNNGRIDFIQLRSVILQSITTLNFHGLDIVMQYIIANNLEIPTNLFRSIVKFCSQSQLEACIKYYLYFKKFGKNDDFIYATMISVFSKKKEIKLMDKTWNEWKTRGVPDQFGYSSYASSLLHHNSFLKMIEVLLEMLELKLELPPSLQKFLLQKEQLIAKSLVLSKNWMFDQDQLKKIKEFLENNSATRSNVD